MKAAEVESAALSLRQITQFQNYFCDIKPVSNTSCVEDRATPRRIRHKPPDALHSAQNTDSSISTSSLMKSKPLK